MNMEEQIKQILINNRDDVDEQVKKIYELFQFNLNRTDVNEEIKVVSDESMLKQKFEQIISTSTSNYDINIQEFKHEFDSSPYYKDEHIINVYIEIKIENIYIEIIDQCGWNRRTDYGYPLDFEIYIGGTRTIYGSFDAFVRNVDEYIHNINERHKLDKHNKLYVELIKMYVKERHQLNNAF